MVNFILSGDVELLFFIVPWAITFSFVNESKDCQNSGTSSPDKSVSDEISPMLGILNGELSFSPNIVSSIILTPTSWATVPIFFTL